MGAPANPFVSPAPPPRKAPLCYAFQAKERREGENVLFGTVLILAFTLLLAYVLWRSSSAPPFQGRIPPRGVALFGLVLWAFFILARVVGHNHSGPLANTLEQFVLTLLAVFFLVALCLLPVDLVTLFGFLLRKQAPALRGAALLAGIALSLFALVQGHRDPSVAEHEVLMRNLPKALDGTVVVVLSDTHLGGTLKVDRFNRWIQQARALRPALMVFVGDILELHDGVPGALPVLKETRPRLGLWYVTGNHDPRDQDASTPRVLRDAGVRRLANQWVKLAPGLLLAGVDDLTRHQRRHPKVDLLERSLALRPPDATILLSHSPLQAERADALDVGLMLSGHTHGGQIWPFGYFVKRIYPRLAGRFRVGEMTLLVSRGVGTWGPRMRLWRRGEILRVTLRSP